MGQIVVLTAYMLTEHLDFKIWPQSKQKSQSNCHAYMRTRVQGNFQFLSMSLIATRTAYMRRELLYLEAIVTIKLSCLHAYRGTFNFCSMGQIAKRTAYMHTKLLHLEIWPQSKQKSQSN